MNVLRNLPAVHEIQSEPVFKKWIKAGYLADDIGTEWIKEELAALRQQLIAGKMEEGQTFQRKDFMELIMERLASRVEQLMKNNLQAVINATGVVLHTNLGRARLSEEAVEHIQSVAAAYSTLEYETDTGERGSRHRIV